MATGGTSAATSLTAIKVGGATDTVANRAAFNALVKDSFPVVDGTTSPPTATYTRQGLFLPGRGLIQVYAGDVVLVDANSGSVVFVPAIAFTTGTPVWITTAN